MKHLPAAVAALAMVTFSSGQSSSAEATGSEATGKIVFSQLDYATEGEDVAVIGADGSHRKMLTHEGLSVAAAWSPDGRRIAFTSARTTPPGSDDTLSYAEVYVMNADGSHVTRITRNVGLFDFEPAWSPDGRQIVVGRGSAADAFTPTGQLKTDLWIINLATGREHQLITSPDTAGYPHWSPDGRRIAFHGDPAAPGNIDVYTIGVDGTGLRRLTTQPGFDENVRYSPDGKSLVFGSDRGGVEGVEDVFRMRTNGTGIRRLTDDPGTDFNPSFSPDGRFLAFASDRDGSLDVFRMRADGTHQTNVTQSPSFDEFDPEWGPR